MDIVLDMETGTSVPPPAMAKPATVQLLVDEARRMHEHLIARELMLIARVERLGQLWLAASALFAAAGLFGGLTADLWLAFGFACGFALSVVLRLPQPATLAGLLMVEFNDPYALADEQTPARLLATLDEINQRACEALAARLRRYTISVVMLSVYVPLALLLRVVGV